MKGIGGGGQPLILAILHFRDLLLFTSCKSCSVTMFKPPHTSPFWHRSSVSPQIQHTEKGLEGRGKKFFEGFCTEPQKAFTTHSSKETWFGLFFKKKEEKVKGKDYQGRKQKKGWFQLLIYRYPNKINSESLFINSQLIYCGLHFHGQPLT